MMVDERKRMTAQSDMGELKGSTAFWLQFAEDSDLVKRAIEFSDSLKTEKFFGRLRAAM